MLDRPGAFQSELNFLVHDALKRAGIEIPFPQRDVHIRSAAGLGPLIPPEGGGSDPE